MTNLNPIYSNGFIQGRLKIGLTLKSAAGVETQWDLGVVDLVYTCRRSG